MGVLLKDSRSDIWRGILAPVGVVALLTLLPGLLIGVLLALAELLRLAGGGEMRLKAGVPSSEWLARSLYSSGVPFCLLTDLKNKHSSPSGLNLDRKKAFKFVRNTTSRDSFYFSK